MDVLLDDNRLISSILEYDETGDKDTNCLYSSVPVDEHVKVAKVDIWEAEANQAQIVVSVIKNDLGLCVPGNHKVFIISSFNMETESPQIVKNEGRRLKRMLLKSFKNKGIRITSNLHFKG